MEDGGVFALFLDIWQCGLSVTYRQATLRFAGVFQNMQQVTL